MKFRLWGKREAGFETEKKKGKRSECREVGLELRLYWFCWLCLSLPQRTQLALWCMAVSFPAAVAGDTSQGVRHHRGLELRCQYSRSRAALWTPVHHYSTETWAVQQKTGYSPVCWPVWAFLPVKLIKWMLVVPNTRHRCSFWRLLLRICEFQEFL